MYTPSPGRDSKAGRHILGVSDSEFTAELQEGGAGLNRSPASLWHLEHSTGSLLPQKGLPGLIPRRSDSGLCECGFPLCSFNWPL